ncbi:Metabotropic glutamate receptor, partial [Fragariocoptes setiger]
MLFALDQINRDNILLPDIQLGAILLDSCSSNTYALNQSLEFIRASINTVESSAFECRDKSSPRPKYGSKMIAGVIGGSYSEVSLQVANLLRLFRIPQVSYASTGTSLSDKSLYDLFARTVPSDLFQARAIADIVQALNWSYVSLVSSEGLYGDSGSKEFMKQAAMRSICIATHEKIAPSADNDTLDALVLELRKKAARGVVLFTRAEDTRELLLAAQRVANWGSQRSTTSYMAASSAASSFSSQQTNNWQQQQQLKQETEFSWIAADGWGTHQKLIEGVEHVARGAITVELQAKTVAEFDNYMRRLTPYNNKRNPWFHEYWEQWFNCQLDPAQTSSSQSSPNSAAAAAAAALTSSLNYHNKSYSDDVDTDTPADSDNETLDDESNNNSNSNGDEDNNGQRERRHTASSSCLDIANTTSSSITNSTQQQQQPASRKRNKESAPNPNSKSSTRNNNINGGGGGRGGGARKRHRKHTSRLPECSPNLHISEANGYLQEQKVQFVVDAVYAMAHALHAAWQHLCHAQPGLVCDALKELNDLAGSEVKFDERGDGPGRYNIYNYRQKSRSSRKRLPVHQQQSRHRASANVGSQDQQQDDAALASYSDILDDAFLEEGNNSINNNSNIGTPHTNNNDDEDIDGAANQQSLTGDVIEEFEYKSVGNWSDDKVSVNSSETVGLRLQLDDIEFGDGERGQVPASYCSLPCKVGQAKIMRTGDHCCWICKFCADYEYLPDEFTCADCGQGRWPVANKSSCYELPQKFLEWHSVYAIVPLAIACLGLASTLFVTLTFVKYIDTPVVKASGRELSFVLLAGIACCHLSTFILLAKPSIVVCGMQRFLVNFGFSLMYASLLVKTNRISRIFDSARKSAKRPSFISPKSQMIITTILVAIQVFFLLLWFALEPPGTRAVSPDGRRDEVILKCRTKGSNFVISLVYNMILITTCTIYAVKTRKIPENFNESKFIGFTMYTTCVIWLAFVPIFFGTHNSYEIQTTTMCVSISLSAYVTLFCLFAQKVYIILFHPDKNVRKLTMNSATYKRPFKAIQPTATGDVMSAGQMSTTSQMRDQQEQSMKMNEHASSVSAGNSGNSASQTAPKSSASMTGGAASPLATAAATTTTTTSTTSGPTTHLPPHPLQANHCHGKAYPLSSTTAQFSSNNIANYYGHHRHSQLINDQALGYRQQQSNVDRYDTTYTCCGYIHKNRNKHSVHNCHGHAHQHGTNHRQQAQHRIGTSSTVAAANNGQQQQQNTMRPTSATIMRTMRAGNSSRVSLWAPEIAHTDNSSNNRSTASVATGGGNLCMATMPHTSSSSSSVPFVVAATAPRTTSNTDNTHSAAHLLSRAMSATTTTTAAMNAHCSPAHYASSSYDGDFVDDDYDDDCTSTCCSHSSCCALADNAGNGHIGVHTAGGHGDGRVAGGEVCSCSVSLADDSGSLEGIDESSQVALGQQQPASGETNHCRDRHVALQEQSASTDTALRAAAASTLHACLALAGSRDAISPAQQQAQQHQQQTARSNSKQQQYNQREQQTAECGARRTTASASTAASQQRRRDTGGTTSDTQTTTTNMRVFSETSSGDNLRSRTTSATRRQQRRSMATTTTTSNDNDSGDKKSSSDGTDINEDDDAELEDDLEEDDFERCRRSIRRAAQRKRQQQQQANSNNRLSNKGRQFDVARAGISSAAMLAASVSAGGALAAVTTGASTGGGKTNVLPSITSAAQLPQQGQQRQQQPQHHYQQRQQVTLKARGEPSLTKANIEQLRERQSNNNVSTEQPLRHDASSVDVGDTNAVDNNVASDYDDGDDGDYSASYSGGSGQSFSASVSLSSSRPDTPRTIKRSNSSNNNNNNNSNANNSNSNNNHDDDSSGALDQECVTLL